MNSKQQFILALLHQGREYLKVIVPFLVGLHAPQPFYMRKNGDLKVLPIGNKPPEKKEPEEKKEKEEKDK